MDEGYIFGVLAALTNINAAKNPQSLALNDHFLKTNLIECFCLFYKRHFRINISVIDRAFNKKKLSIYPSLCCKIQAIDAKCIQMSKYTGQLLQECNLTHIGAIRSTRERACAIIVQIRRLKRRQ